MSSPISRVARVELFHVAIPLPATFRPDYAAAEYKALYVLTAECRFSNIQPKVFLLGIVAVTSGDSPRWEEVTQWLES